jgi:hypothetical protein
MTALRVSTSGIWVIAGALSGALITLSDLGSLARLSALRFSEMWRCLYGVTLLVHRDD